VEQDIEETNFEIAEEQVEEMSQEMNNKESELKRIKAPKRGRPKKHK
jgi:hypothetical protein